MSTLTFTLIFHWGNCMFVSEFQLGLLSLVIFMVVYFIATIKYNRSVLGFLFGQSLQNGIGLYMIMLSIILPIVIGLISQHVSFIHAPFSDKYLFNGMLTYVAVTVFACWATVASYNCTNIPQLYAVRNAHFRERASWVTDITELEVGQYVAQVIWHQQPHYQKYVVIHRVVQQSDITGNYKFLDEMAMLPIHNSTEEVVASAIKKYFDENRLISLGGNGIMVQTSTKPQVMTID